MELGHCYLCDDTIHDDDNYHVVVTVLCRFLLCESCSDTQTHAGMDDDSMDMTSLQTALTILQEATESPASTASSEQEK